MTASTAAPLSTQEEQQSELIPHSNDNTDIDITIVDVAAANNISTITAPEITNTTKHSDSEIVKVEIVTADEQSHGKDNDNGDPQEQQPVVVVTAAETSDEKKKSLLLLSKIGKSGAWNCGQWALWSIVTFFAVIVFVFSARYFSFSDSAFAFDHFKRERAFVYIHIICGSFALLLSPLQFLDVLKRRYLKVHRIIGRIYAMLSILGGISAFAMSFLSKGGLVSHFGFGFLAILWTSSTLIAIYYIKYCKRNDRKWQIDHHQQWMIRSFSLILAAVTLRIWNPVLTIFASFDSVYPAVAWLCWVPNLLCAEIYIRWSFQN